jgi:hypothetical protein
LRDGTRLPVTLSCCSFRLVKADAKDLSSSFLTGITKSTVEFDRVAEEACLHVARTRGSASESVSAAESIRELETIAGKAVAASVKTVGR